MSDRTTFRLPGHELNEVAERKCLLSILAAYSRQWNPRNLEAPWYDPWTQVFADLVARHASLSAAPHPYLWYKVGDRQLAHTMPSAQHLLSTEDEQLDELQDDIGDITLSSIKSISVPHHSNCCRIPDIAITRKVSFPRSENDSSISHLACRVTYTGFPLLAELKPSGSCSHDVRKSLRFAMMPMLRAQEQLVKQALHLLQAYPHQKSVVLVAITGFWWSYMVFNREQTNDLLVVDEEEEEDPGFPDEEDASIWRDQDGIHPDLAEAPSDSEEESIRELYGFDLDTLQDISLEEAQFHMVLPEEKLRLRENDWSDYLLYGTAPSNQILSLILDRLHSIVHVYYDGKMG
ncbi:hypothetical protein JVT61DRAFT_5863 [Boletus reticuloceps]|uniref:Uncharacterized protein n=1 Tax=Boletus reticuloceps TaxID=495285 RepID=A0A8I3A6U2_9AGAM|nr:hypothetical protein JVT61DRAFT_5863 [Boletus reticuloceps]